METTFDENTLAFYKEDGTPVNSTLDTSANLIQFSGVQPFETYVLQGQKVTGSIINLPIILKDAQ